MREARESAASIDPIRQYLNEIGRHPLLSAEEELETAITIRDGAAARSELQEMITLADELNFDIDEERLAPLEQKIQAGDEASEKMIRSNLRLVVSVAKRYQSSGIPLLDLVQEGNISLFRAVEKFDPDKGFKFSTYATWWIRQGITRSIADQSRTIRLPVHIHEQLSALHRAETELIRQNVKPTPEHLAEELGSDVEKVRKLIEARDRTQLLELDKPIGEDEGMVMGDTIGVDDTTFETVEESLRSANLGHIALSVLTHREIEIILCRFKDNMTLEAVGNEFGVTRERVRQIESKALSKLRTRTLSSPGVAGDEHLESLLENNSGNLRDIRHRYDVSPVVLDAVRSQLEQRRSY